MERSHVCASLSGRGKGGEEHARSRGRLSNDHMGYTAGTAGMAAGRPMWNILCGWTIYDFRARISLGERKKKPIGKTGGRVRAGLERGRPRARAWGGRGSRRDPQGGGEGGRSAGCGAEARSGACVPVAAQQAGWEESGGRGGGAAAGGAGESFLRRTCAHAAIDSGTAFRLDSAAGAGGRGVVPVPDAIGLMGGRGGCGGGTRASHHAA